MTRDDELSEVKEMLANLVQAYLEAESTPYWQSTEASDEVCQRAHLYLYGKEIDWRER
jgi:hypothetical protein